MLASRLQPCYLVDKLQPCNQVATTKNPVCYSANSKVVFTRAQGCYILPFTTLY